MLSNVPEAVLLAVRDLIVNLQHAPRRALLIQGAWKGRIILSPASPVARQGEPNQRPIQGQVAVIDASGTVVTEIASDSQGVFTIDLPVGHYMLRLENMGGMGAFQPQPELVTVQKGQVTSVVLTFDSGIR